VDTFGTIWGSIFSTGLIALGTVLQAVSTNLHSFPVMVTGSVLYGIGSGTIMVVQEVMLTRWFSGRGLAVTLGCQIAVGRLAAFLAMVTVVPLTHATGFYGWAYWLSAGLCVISFMFTLVYVYFLWRIRHDQLSEFSKEISQKRRFSANSMLRIPAAMWFLLALCLTLGGGWAVYLHIIAEIISLKFHKNDTTAATITSVTQIPPVVLAPFMGVIIDRYRVATSPIRVHNIVILKSAVLFLVSIVMLMYTAVDPVVSAVIFSISLATGPVAMMSAIPLLLPLSSLGTGTGAYKSCGNIGSTLLDIVAGGIQDWAGYDMVLIVMAVVAALAVISSLGMWWNSKNVSWSLSPTQSGPELLGKPRWWSLLWAMFICISLLASIVIFVLSLVHHRA